MFQENWKLVVDFLSYICSIFLSKIIEPIALLSYTLTNVTNIYILNTD